MERGGGSGRYRSGGAGGNGDARWPDSGSMSPLDQRREKIRGTRDSQRSFDSPGMCGNLVMTFSVALY